MLNVEGSRRSRRNLQPSAFSLQPSQRGVALIITIILLGVVTFMAIAFLALSRRERGAVTTVTDTASARLAADAALASAEAQIIANVATNNPFNCGLFVSTNYINLGAHQTLNPTDTNYSDVNYYDSSGYILTGNAFLQNLLNLWYSPRPPVFIPTNAAGVNDFRFYLDLNRNGRYDPSGWVENYDNNNTDLKTTSYQVVGDPEWIGILQRPDQPYGPNNPFVARYAFIAVPVGNTLDLNAIHNQVFDENNPPNTLVSPNLSDAFYRNQGVGSWEINLAAFLADLNTNVWLPTVPPDNTYYYYQLPSGYNQGIAFYDAGALLAWRYNNNYRSLSSVDNLFGSFGDYAFRNDSIDGYSDGPLQYNLQLSSAGDTINPKVNDDPSLPWPGADNTNHFFNMQELFNPAESYPAFTNRLSSAGTNSSTYNRYTFYRLLSQLGTDSQPESGKMNLNYDNMDLFITNQNGLRVTNRPASTNFMAWTPLAFFTNAADRLLRAYTTQWRNSNPTNFATTFYTATSTNILFQNQWANYPAFGLSGAPGVIPGIPVLVSNQFVYSAAVNRLLQLAANMYDATTNSFYPSVFRPLFSRDANGFGTNVYITGFTNVVLSSADDPQLAAPFDISALSTMNVPNGMSNLAVNVYGVPWIIGAKKGFPSFYQLYMTEVGQVTRKLEVTRGSTNQMSNLYTNYDTNQMYVMSITNNIGLSFWNSYSNFYPRPLTVYARDWLQMNMTNFVGYTWGVSNVNFYIPAVPRDAWPGSQWGAPGITSPLIAPNIPPGSFYYTNWSYAFLPESVYRFGSGSFLPNSTNITWETKADYTPELSPLPQFTLATTNNLQAYILDYDGTRYYVIDYVHLRGPLDNTNLNQALADPDYPDSTGMYHQWSTNPHQAPDPMTFGVYNQLVVSQIPGHAPGNSWIRPHGMPGSLNSSTPGAAESAFFNAFFLSSFLFTDPVTRISQSVTNTQGSVQAPYTPSRTVFNYILWQANDPLVHCLASDLNVAGSSAGWNHTDNSAYQLPPPSGTQYAPGQRFQPWGLNKQMAGLPNVNANAYNSRCKDPLIWCPDNWDFPANKFPTVGWLGRVHRGTPWQTVYLKASNILLQNGSIGTNTWAQWTGDTRLTYGQYFDADNSAPVQDWLLFDLFTTAFDDNATRGTLSVNQSANSFDPAAGLAAWSALFSGMVAISNNTAVPTPSYTNRPTTAWTFINPAGVYDSTLPLAQQPIVVRIAQSINQTRTNTTLFPLGAFTHLGDILSVPVLTERSPFLNTNFVYSYAPPLLYGISDEVYEWLPQQMMSLLRCSSSPRYVIYCYGQALKPAPDSVYTTGGPFFGMVTNYQIVSEIATRAVVRFNSSVTNVITTLDGTNWYSQPVVTNNNAVIESFNPLPPD